uniref:Uncharacterized protein n=1 Tax=Cacopsylla melanoneura TaxID=428564 RepID=A0A8D8M0S5_9HEMI
MSQPGTHDLRISSVTCPRRWPRLPHPQPRPLRRVPPTLPLLSPPTLILPRLNLVRTIAPSRVEVSERRASEGTVLPLLRRRRVKEEVVMGVRRLRTRRMRVTRRGPTSGNVQRTLPS